MEKLINKVKLILICTICIFSSLESYAKIRGSKLKRRPRINISRVKKELNKKRLLIKKLTQDIDKLEKDLNGNNKKIISILNRKKEVEDNIFSIQIKLVAERKKLEKEHYRTNKLFQNVLVGKLNKNKDSANMLASEILTKSLNNRLVRLNLLKEKIKKSEINLVNLNKFFTELNIEESSVNNIVASLEKLKKKSAEKYLKEVKVRSKLQLKYDKYKVKKSLQRAKRVVKKNSSIKRKFLAPLKSFIGIEFKKKKGVNFLFSGKKKVIASELGTVVYQKSFAAYGNIVMIDHGQDVRSVILGRFDPKVKKGDVLKKGDVVGFTQFSKIKSGKIYFEIRKKNKVLNTIHYIDKKSLSIVGSSVSEKL